MCNKQQTTNNELRSSKLNGYAKQTQFPKS